MSKGNFEGVLVPVLTPFNSDFSPDPVRFVEQCQWLLAEGANGLAVFGTTSEANSLSLRQREELLDRLVESGIPAAKLMPGTGACALDDAVRMTSKAVNLGCGGVLMHPPFYYKPVVDDGIFAYFSEVIQRVGESTLKIYLYHIPPITMIPFSIDLVGRLIATYPETVIGLKDSSGDWSNTETLLREYPEFDIFPGSEAFLLQGLRAGARGCITATGNANVAGIRQLVDNWQSDDADAMQARITTVRMAIQAFPLIPALKAMMARIHDAPEWRRVAPPLMPLGEDETRALFAKLAGIDFAMAPHGSVAARSGVLNG